MMFCDLCQQCGETLIAGSRFCHHCGKEIQVMAEEEKLPQPATQAQPRLGVFLLTLAGSVGLTLILTLVFHMPIFILGAFLPFFWQRKGPGR